MGNISIKNWLKDNKSETCMVAHCYHSKTSLRCFLNLKRKENKAHGCDKKIKKKQLELKNSNKIK